MEIKEVNELTEELYAAYCSSSHPVRRILEMDFS